MDGVKIGTWIAPILLRLQYLAYWVTWWQLFERLPLVFLRHLVQLPTTHLPFILYHVDRPYHWFRSAIVYSGFCNYIFTLFIFDSFSSTLRRWSRWIMFGFNRMFFTLRILLCSTIGICPGNTLGGGRSFSSWSSGRSTSFISCYWAPHKTKIIGDAVMSRVRREPFTSTTSRQIRLLSPKLML